MARGRVLGVFEATGRPPATACVCVQYETKATEIAINSPSRSAGSFARAVLGVLREDECAELIRARPCPNVCVSWSVSRYEVQSRFRRS